MRSSVRREQTQRDRRAVERWYFVRGWRLRCDACHSWRRDKQRHAHDVDDQLVHFRDETFMLALSHRCCPHAVNVPRFKGTAAHEKFQQWLGPLQQLDVYCGAKEPVEDMHIRHAAACGDGVVCSIAAIRSTCDPWWATACLRE